MADVVPYLSGENVVEIFGIATAFGLPILLIFAWLLRRTFVHRERMEMIRQGLVPDARAARARDAAAGYPAGGEPALVVLRKGIRLAFIGAALTIGLASIGWHDGELNPGPWLLGGLVPLFIGLSQIVTAMLSDPTALAAVMRAFGRGGPPPPEPPPYRPAPPPTGPYTYRPDETEPLRRPGQPPRKP